MAGPVIRQQVDGVCRFSSLMHWAGTGQRIVNVFDMHIFNRGLGTSREDAVADQADIIGRQYVADLFPHLVDDLVYDETTWVDLDTIDGSIGSSSEGAGETGEETGSSCAPDAAVLIKKVVTHRRGQRSGRFFLPGILEGDIDQNGVVAVGDFDDAVASFLDNINQFAGELDPAYDSKLVVCHFPPRTEAVDGVLHGTFSDVEELVPEALKSNQKRRVGR